MHSDPPPDDVAFTDGDEEEWESAAKNAIHEASSGIAFDEVRRSIYLISGEDPRFDRVDEEFRDWKTLKTRLIEIGEKWWNNYAPFYKGKVVPEYAPDVESCVNDVIAKHDVAGFFSRLTEPDQAEELVSADELLEKGAGLILEIDVAEINAELVQYLAKHPEKLRDMEPRKFEELVAELFKDKGYDVEVTPRSKDGGLDIRVFQKSELGRFLTLVECKRYAESQRVGVAIVRGLYGVVNMQNATSGLIATTSFFTKGAKSEQQTVKNRLHLADFDELKRWLAGYRSR